jgi:NADH-quinone oxidoreductase subunit L
MDFLLPILFLLPLAGAVLNGVLCFLIPETKNSPDSRNHGKTSTVAGPRAGAIATLAALASFLTASLLTATWLQNKQSLSWQTDWFSVGASKLTWGFSFDGLTAVMSLVVTGIGTLIHLYSIGYMSHDEGKRRYFSYLNLFLAAMLLLVLGDNLAVLFVGWEGVGLCSYLLIGFWYSDLKKSDAGIKAFVVNRIGDAGMLLGIFLCLKLFGTVRFTEIKELLSGPTSIAVNELSWLSLFLFIGAMGKSAQIPLYVWLPDAMAGPTPVSALIHAATMVTAGVYLVCRMSFLYQITGEVGRFIAMTGGTTALFAATIACAQRDIKKVLAYSTVSQLGLMFLGAGIGAYTAAVFHLITHAFFKACLFLGAGSVIHALSGEQDIFHMGGLRKSMPATHITFALSVLAISGIAPLSGFFSKDAILYAALASPSGGLAFWIVGLIVSCLTAFYMMRLLILVFWNQYRGDRHPHESPWVMTVPLWCTAAGAVFAGALSLPHEFHALTDYLGRTLEGSVISPGLSHDVFISESWAMGIALSAGLLGIAAAVAIYRKSYDVRKDLTTSVGSVLLHGYWIDELYRALFLAPFHALSNFLARVVDPQVIDGSVLLLARLCRGGALVISSFQNGLVRHYLVVMLIGTLILVWALVSGGAIL